MKRRRIVVVEVEQRQKKNPQKTLVALCRSGALTADLELDRHDIASSYCKSITTSATATAKRH